MKNLLVLLLSIVTLISCQDDGLTQNWRKMQVKKMQLGGWSVDSVHQCLIYYGNIEQNDKDYWCCFYGDCSEWHIDQEVFITPESKPVETAPKTTKLPFKIN